jgi:hypothetical protein
MQINYSRYIAGLILLWLVPDITGADLWGPYRKTLEANGVVFDYKKIIPKPVPKDKNFALVPAFNQTPANISKGIASGLSLTRWQNSKSIELEDWRDALKKEGWVMPDKPGAPASDILFALRKNEEWMKQLSVAAKARPLCRFDVNYEDGLEAGLPHLSTLRWVVRVFILRSLSLIEVNKTNAAFADLEMALFLANCIKDEPILISQLVRSAILNITMQAVWEGLAKKKWNAEQLSILEKHFASINCFQEYRKVMQGERVIGIQTLEKLKGDIDKAKELLGVGFPGNDFSIEWFHKNMINLNEFHLNYHSQVFDAKPPILQPNIVNEFADEWEVNGKNKDYLLCAMMMPSFGWMSRLAQIQAAVDQARLSCQLELYHLKHQKYPKRLKGLRPPLPVDLMNGKSYVYKPDIKGRYLLYGVGWNQKDDGGKVAPLGPPHAGGIDHKTGDIVWGYIPAGLAKP